MANPQEKMNTMLDEDQKFAVELLAWANSHKFADNSYLTAVAKDINDKQNYAFWAEQNALDLLPSTDSSVGQKYLRASRLLAIIRNVLIFLPVALTWAAVGNATSAFGRFIELNGTTTVNFLDFWQNGYDLLDPFWRIGSVAEKVFIIILLVIFITLISSTIFSYGRDLNERANEIFDEERSNIAIRINKYFFDRKTTTPLTINKDVIKSIDSLNTAAKNLLAATNSVNKMSNTLEDISKKTESLQKNIEQLTKVGKLELETTLNGFSENIKDSSQQLSAASRQIIELIEKMGDFIKMDVAKSLADSKSQIDSVNKEISNSSNAVSKDAENLQAEIRQLHKKLSDIVTRLK